MIGYSADGVLGLCVAGGLERGWTGRESPLRTDFYAVPMHYFLTIQQKATWEEPCLSWEAFHMPRTGPIGYNYETLPDLYVHEDEQMAIEAETKGPEAYVQEDEQMASGTVKNRSEARVPDEKTLLRQIDRLSGKHSKKTQRTAEHHNKM